jgi:precorrin-3B synthase
MTHFRRACPALSAPMATGDGLLVRFVPAGPIPLDALIDLCAAARAHGNGVMEITARGSVQVRGLTPLSAPLFAEAVEALGIDLCEGVPVLCDPLSGDPAALIDAHGVAAKLRRAIIAAGLRLAPKVSVVVDGGGRIDFDALSADIRLRAVPADGGPKFRLGVAGNAKSATRLGLVFPTEAVEAVLDLLAQIAELGPEARGADLLDRPAFPPQDDDPSPNSPRADPIGLHPLKDGALAVGVGLPFGQVDAEALMELARRAKTHGAGWLRPAPGRSLLLGPLGSASADAMTQAAQALGFVTEARDPRRRIAACPGAPACAHGLIAARALAADIARDVPLEGDGIVLHVSGCAKGCAHPRPAPLVIVGTERGWGMVRNGMAQAAPSAYVSPADLVAELGRLMGKAREKVDA